MRKMFNSGLSAKPFQWLMIAISLLALSNQKLYAQTAVNWNNTNSSWTTGSSWTGGTAPTTNSQVAIFGSVTPITFQPTVDGAITLRGLSVNNTGDDWQISGTNAINLAVGGSWTSGAANTTVVGLDVFGGGSTTISAPIIVGASNQFWQVGAATTLVLAGGISNTGTNSLSYRVTGGSTIRFDANSTQTGAINLGSLGSSGIARYEINTANAFGSGNLSIGGGTALATQFNANTTDRTIANPVTQITATLIGSGTNSLTFTNNVSVVAGTTATRSIQSDITTANKWLRFNGSQFNIRAANSTATTANVTFVGSGRTEINAVIANGSATLAGDIVVGSGGGFSIVRITNPNNSYTGTTTLASGQLLIAESVPASGNGPLGAATSAVNIANTGSVSQSLLMDGVANTTFSRPITIQSTNAGVTSLGVNSPTTATYNGAITVGTSANANNKSVNLVAPTNATVIIDTDITRAAGYTNTITLGKAGLNGGSGTAIINTGRTINLSNAGANFAVSVTSGELQVNGTIGTGTGLSVANAATLSGMGTINQAITVNSGGILNPGTTSTIGTLTAGGNVTINSGANQVNWNIDLNAVPTNTVATAAGPADVDQLAVGANTLNLASLTSANRLNVNLTSRLGTFVSFDPVSYTIATKDAAGQFQLNGTTFAFDPALINVVPTNFQIDPSYTLIVDNNNLVLTFVPVPEPTLIVGVTVLAGAGLNLIRRKRNVAI